MRVLLVAPLPPPMGGMARWTQVLMQRAESVDAPQVVLVNSATRRSRFFTDSSIHRALGGSRQALHVLSECLRAICESPPDVAYVATSGGPRILHDVATMSLLRLVGIPCVYHLRFGRLPALSRAASTEWKLLRVAFSLARLTVVLDKASAQCLGQAMPNCKVEVIPNPIRVPAEPHHMLTERSDVVLHAGHVSESKGILDLLDAWKDADTPGGKLRLVGEIDPNTAPFAASECRRRPSVEAPGEVSHEEVLSEIGRAAMLVLPSHSEGFPNELLEAMSGGCPIIATAVGAIPEMIGQDCGIDIPPRDVVALRFAVDIRHVGHPPQPIATKGSRVVREQRDER